MDDEKNVDKGEQAAAPSRPTRDESRTADAHECMGVARLFCRAMKIAIVGKDRPFWRPEAIEVFEIVRRWFRRPAGTNRRL